MLIPSLLIIAGVYIYYASFGWTFDVYAGLGLYSSAFFVIIGLYLIMKRPRE